MKVRSTLDRQVVNPESLREAIERLRAGEVIAFPTETFYGLGAVATEEAAVRRVREMKMLPDERAIPVVIYDRRMVAQVAADPPPAAVALMERHWPGPLTLVIPAGPDFGPALLGAAREIGVRVSSHPVALQLADRLRRPLTSTSANPHGQPPARTPDEVRRYWPDLFVIDGGETPGSVASTVVRFQDGRPVVLRQGTVRIHPAG